MPKETIEFKDMEYADGNVEAKASTTKSGTSEKGTVEFKEGTFTDKTTGVRYDALHRYDNGKLVKVYVDNKEVPIEKGKYIITDVKTRSVLPAKGSGKLEKTIKEYAKKKLPRSINDLKKLAEKKSAMEVMGDAISETYIQPVKKALKEAKKKGGKLPNDPNWLRGR